MHTLSRIKLLDNGRLSSVHTFPNWRKDVLLLHVSIRSLLAKIANVMLRFVLVFVLIQAS